MAMGRGALRVPGQASERRDELGEVECDPAGYAVEGGVAIGRRPIAAGQQPVSGNTKLVRGEHEVSDLWPARAAHPVADAIRVHPDVAGERRARMARAAHRLAEPDGELATLGTINGV